MTGLVEKVDTMVTKVDDVVDRVGKLEKQPTVRKGAPVDEPVKPEPKPEPNSDVEKSQPPAGSALSFSVPSE
jgi:hypothetical protein